MTAALHVSSSGARVGAVELLWQSDGNNRRARFGLTYAEGSGPEIVFVKAEGNYRETHARNGNLFNEVRLLGSGVPLHLDHPATYAALIDEPALDWLVVMEDVTRRGADPRDSTRPYTIEQVTNGVLGLAAMHARFWRLTARSEPRLAWVRTWGDSTEFTEVLRGGAARGLERMTGLMPPELDGCSSDYFVDQFARYLTVLGRDPLTFLHGDAHIGNTYVLPDDSVGFLDWQVAHRGNWSQDVGYFVQGALVPADRRAAERGLIENYRTTLDRGLSADDAWTWYRASPVWGLAMWLATLGSDGGSQPFDVCQALVHRHAVAAVELDAHAALDQIAARVS
ncbi:phosphotransferase [Parafrankia sp. FMc2]|uniref:phosphotransferase n=1 Tax=Parafrankia sp. FMc2 TaxID=3233196 RepID=UPI0034D5D376